MKKKKDEAIKYVYTQAVSSKIPYNVFEECILKSSCDELPEFYIIKTAEEYIGYILLLADSIDTLPKPFTFLACHNGDELSKENHISLLQFVLCKAKEKHYSKLEWLANNELLPLT